MPSIALIHPMNDTKPWYESIAVWGGLIACLSPLLRLLGYEVDTVQATDLLTECGSLVGGVLAIVGRITATKLIAKTPRGPSATLG
jgi:hypothetical protein